MASISESGQPNTVQVHHRIMHVDLDAFFCSVEELFDPTLRGKPFVVGGSPTGRGVVCSASYPARAFGIHNAMPASQALRLCPGLILAPVRYGVYSDYSHRVMSLLKEYGPQFQQMSIDEAYLDLTGLRESPLMLANEIQTRIRDELQLPASIGVATSKLVAKMAGSSVKPNGIRIIEEGDEEAFLAPLKIGDLIGIGEATAQRLHRIGIMTIGQLAHADKDKLRPIFGDHVDGAISRARGEQYTGVHTERDAKSISTERTFSRDVNDEVVLRNALLSMSDEIGGRLRAENLYTRSAHLKLRWPDFTTITRQETLPFTTQLSEDIFATVEHLWHRAWRKGQHVRLIGVGVSDLRTSEEQLPMFEHERREQLLALSHVTDRLREKYGRNVIKRASLNTKRK
ncbi:MAG TPA: DNA polymerase IV [Anaerolineae bacterium]